jgi:hypothetical protein
LTMTGNWRRIVQSDSFSIVLLIVVFKLGLFVLSGLSFPLLGSALPAGRLLEFVPAIWSRWDGVWYLLIAEQGYPVIGEWRYAIVFFPLYPMLVRLVSFLGISIAWAGLAVANAAAAAGLFLFYKLARFEFGREVGWLALAALLVFPTAYFFNAPYTEGLFLLLAVGSFYAARRQEWVVAGLLGGYAALTRVTGVLLFPALLVEFYLQHREGRRPSLGAATSLLLIPAMFSIYLMLNWVLFDDPLAFTEMLHSFWYKTFSWPWYGLAESWLRIGGPPWETNDVLYGLAEFGAGVALILATEWALFRLRLSYAVYMLLVTFMVLSTSYLASTPRYMLSAFPIFFLFGKLLARSRTLTFVWLAGSMSLLTVLAARYVHHWWAF